jgi:hypothetical protein
VDLEAERTPCGWKTEEEKGGKLMQLKRAEMVPVLVVKDDDDETTGNTKRLRK